MKGNRNMIKGYLADLAMSLLIKMLPAILDNISGDLRSLITQFIQNAEERASKTKNKFDDLLVDLVKIILGID